MGEADPSSRRGGSPWHAKADDQGEHHSTGRETRAAGVISAHGGGGAADRQQDDGTGERSADQDHWG